MGRPAGRPSTVDTSACPCDSPAVRNRSINRRFYTPVGRSARRVGPAARELRQRATGLHTRRFAARFQRPSHGWRSTLAQPRGMTRSLRRSHAPNRAAVWPLPGACCETSPSGLVDLATGLPRPPGEPASCRESHRRGWRVAGHCVRGRRGHVVLDAWLTQDWLGDGRSVSCTIRRLPTRRGGAGRRAGTRPGRNFARGAIGVTRTTGCRCRGAAAPPRHARPASCRCTGAMARRARRTAPAAQWPPLLIGGPDASLAAAQRARKRG